nr:immunoglobulin heavy chain junction region [Macaca mulatta]MOX38870.1 immunoglobulin heavy chain junction region [Macaca mulatta]MOX39620.1 immunoglobulin heavy chain junction region [Macaca mulatta]MOX39894.1 immunoglobulin heavy chain junction region [Macaca mulatta]MOX40470.1 immunoglobulin heavy chain junction region [Macaca mulatta]
CAREGNIVRVLLAPPTGRFDVW